MNTPFLIVTAETSFGTLITKGLSTDRFKVFVTSDFSKSIHFVRKNNCPVAILDAELEEVDISILDVGYALRQINPEIKFIVVTAAGQKPNLGKLAPVATLPKPISVPDLENLLDTLNISSTKTASASDKPAPEAKPETKMQTQSVERDMAETSNLLWLKDVSKAAQHLTQLTLESSAQAALITRENELWAYAGQLSREAAQELGQSIQRYWDRETESDLLRFVRLASTDAQHMLYARKLSASMILALVFDAETPFSTIRTQAGKLVRTLSGNPVEEQEQKQNPREALADPLSEEPLALEAAGAQPGMDFGTDEDDDMQDLPPISQLLGDVPPPIPARQAAAATRTALPWEQPRPAGRSGGDKLDTTPSVSRPVTFSRESSPAMPVNSIRENLAPGTPAMPSAPAMDETRVSRISDLGTETETEIDPNEIPEEMQATRKHEPEHDDMEAVIETRPQGIESVTEVAHRILLEPASPALVNLTYACLLIPRFDTHHLVGDIAERLTEWVPQVCVAFGWRLEHLAVRPQYLQWVARVPPSTAPGYIMRIIRQQTSERLFGEFPRHKADNPSGDFWAPGYMIMGSSQPLPQKLVREFILQTRQRQGLGH
jgi:REP element-mobilizing transposase RayT/DNA-binding response OmpR family regulator